jgi:UDP-glucose 4-epimerase
LSRSRSVLVTGGSGYIGNQLVADLASNRGELETIVSLDLRPVLEDRRLDGVHYCTGDIRDPGIGEAFRSHAVDTVVHLAAIVTPGKESSRELEHSIDVLGTRNVIDHCLAAGVRKLIVASSGAAYGYHADNPQPLTEDDVIRGNPEFAYSDHKRQVEEMLARYRREHPELAQLVFRPGTILGEQVANQITAIFERPLIIGVRGAEIPFVFIWDGDVVACLRRGIEEESKGIYNLAGDGVLSLAEIARRLGKPYVAPPAAAIRAALRLLHPLGLSPYGPEQVDFLRYRPVLSNAKLKSEFGYTPRLTTAEVFDLYRRSRASG